MPKEDKIKFGSLSVPVKLSHDYLNFLLEERLRREPKNWYEKLCKLGERLSIKPPKSLELSLKKDIAFSTLNVTPEGVLGASVLGMIATFLFGVIFSLIVNDPMLSTIVLLLPLGVFYYLYSYPSFVAEVLRVQAGDEAIKIILYMVIYLKLNPSFEGAVNFAAAHAKGPLSEDLKKAMWDLQMGKYKTVEEALAAYMPKWVNWNEDFVRAITLLYGVLIEPKEEGRERIMMKSLNFLLDETHKKLKEYVEEISPKITILHVMGLLLPVMGLIMFPMISIFMSGEVNTWHLIFGYLIVLPLINLFFITRILMKRPGAFMVPDISKHPELPPKNMFYIKLKRRKVPVPILPIVISVAIIVSIPGLLHFVDLYSRLAKYGYFSLERNTAMIRSILEEETKLTVDNVGSTLSITLAVGLAAFLFFYLRSFQRIKIRNEIKNIESEFRIGLFSLGNFLSEGYPIEVAVEKSLDEYERLGMQKRPTYWFFKKLLYKLRSLGMTFERALFDPKEGLLKFYPSVLIEEIMRILVSASYRSSQLLGKIAKTIATYLETLNNIEAKIRELLEEVRSSLKTQAGFVIPLVTGITASLTMFLLDMLRRLSKMLEQLEKALGMGMISGSMSNIMDTMMGDFTRVVPMTVLQATIGIYTVEIIILLSYLLNGIENGFDEVSRDWIISQNLKTALMLYVSVAIMALIVFGQVAEMISF